MAVRADNLNKLINKDAPYVHSNIANFRTIHRQSLLHAKEKGNRLKKTLEDMKKVKQDLKKQTDAFLGRLTPQEFIKKYYFGEGKEQKEKFDYYKAFTRYFQHSGFFAKLNQKVAYEMQDVIEKFTTNTTIAKKIFDAEKILPLGQMAKNILNAVVQEIEKEQRKKGGKRKYEIKLLENGKKVTDILDGNLAKIFSLNDKGRKKSMNTLTKEIKEFLKDKLGEKKIKLAEETEKILRNDSFKEFIEQELQKEYNDPKINLDNNKTFIEYRENFISRLYYHLKDTQISQQSEISGNMGEAYEISMLEAIGGKNLGGVLLTGTWNEQQIREEIFKGLKDTNKKKHKKYKGPNKEKNSPNSNEYIPWKQEGEKVQSYSDFVLVNPQNGMRARVQSKYYQEIVDKFKPNEKNMLQHINLFKREDSIPEFIKSLQTTGQVFSDMDPNGVAYVIANSLWFSYNGSINSSNVVSNQKIDNREIFSELGAAAGNFLGIIVDNSLTPIQEFSNLFFLINNEILLPTWVILDELIKMIRYSNVEETISSLSMTKSANSTSSFKTGYSATSFKKKKAEAISGDSITYENSKGELKTYTGVFIHDGGYFNEDLVDVGTEMGKNIIDSTNMRKINLDIDYEKAIKSAYNLF